MLSALLGRGVRSHAIFRASFEGDSRELAEVVGRRRYYRRVGPQGTEPLRDDIQRPFFLL